MSRSTHTYLPSELSCSHSPWGLNYLRDRLLFAGYTNPTVRATNGLTEISVCHELIADPRTITVTVDEGNAAKSQLLFDMKAPSGSLTANQSIINVPPLSTQMVTITGPVGKTVKVRFAGVGFVLESQFVIPGSSNYDFQFGACPAGQRVVTPQMYDFYVEDGSCAPVAILATFR